ncbi:MAG: methylmalonyl-CoA mutase [Rhizobiales bacterium 65-9]|nr:methylmalonyl-CoA mutase subunit beta [Hyphomicrobiales bacterium]OJY38009.1 MAG: methylmalonyl-CoA mutase [Rhizobiales bacterium 65-9]
MTDLALAAEFPAASDSQWRDAVARALKGADFDKKLLSRTDDGLVIRPLYPKADGSVTARATPGPWRIVQRADIPDLALAREQALEDLEGGASGLALVLAGARGARGFGLAIENVADLDRALDGVRLDLIATRIETAPWGGRAVAALVAALVERRGYDRAGLAIDFGLDPIGDFSVRGQAAAPFETMFSRIHEVAATLRSRGYAAARFIRCDARWIHEAGASEAQELAYALAAGVAYLRALDARGTSLDEARGMLSFLLVADADEFLTIAKLRAMRKLWARVESACGLAPRPIQLDAETAWRMVAKRDPHTNMLRATIAAFSAGVGGADSVLILPHTIALGAPDAFARRVARNAQLILQEESNLAKVADPAAGAGGFEALTDALCEKAWSLFQDIERDGGVTRALTDGKMQARVAATREARDKSIATRRTPITGVSEFPNLTETAVATLAVTPPAERPQRRERLPGARLDFSGMIAQFADGLSRGAMSAPPQQDERCEPLPSHRLAEAYEALRDRSDAALAATGRRPRVFLANLGALASFTARASFAKNFFEAGGVETVGNDGFSEGDGTDLVAMTDAFKQSGAAIACICGADDSYQREAADAALALGASGAAAVYLAGRPGDLEPALRAAGVGDFIYAGCEATRRLAEAQEHALGGDHGDHAGRGGG